MTTVMQVQVLPTWSSSVYGSSSVEEILRIDFIRGIYLIISFIVLLK